MHPSRPDSLNHLAETGYLIRPFPDPAPLTEAQAVCRAVLQEFGLQGDLTTYHERIPDQETHLRFAHGATTALNQTDIVERLFRPETGFLIELLGPDVVIQAAPHLRVGRAGEEQDSIGLHRDSFYGSSIWHLNCWFPLIPLGPGSGLLLADGTHRVPSRGLRDHAFTDPFRSQVQKGSTAHRLGFVYHPRIDDTIATLTPEQLSLISPPFGSYILFFGCMVHGGENRSSWTRWTVDVRFSRPNDGASTRSEYFRPFTQGLISKVAEEFYAA